MGKLTLEEKREEIKKLLDEQEDSHLLDEVYEILKPKSDPVLRERLIARALRSEEDIKQGRLNTPEEALARLDKLFKK